MQTKDNLELSLDRIAAQIGNRQAQRQQLWEKIIGLDGEIAGLREAQHQIEKQRVATAA